MQGSHVLAAAAKDLLLAEVHLMQRCCAGPKGILEAD